MRLSSGCRIGALLALASPACDRDPGPSILSQPVAGTSVRPGPLGMPSAAVEAILEARCARAQRCNRIGPGREYPTRDDCAQRTRAEWSGELNRIECGRGVDEGALRACLHALSTGDCGNELRGACRAMDVCDRPPQPPPAPLARDPAVPG
jgi:hypothetical protein